VSDTPTVLDASALLAILGSEEGADALPQGDLPRISAVNLLEASIVLVRRGLTPRRARSVLDAFALDVVPFDASMIERATAIHAKTRAKGLSLGDAACLATAHACGGTAYTADRAWRSLDVGVPIRLIR
jgi:PIN domain nuclease of toxin-antitoxin system